MLHDLLCRYCWIHAVLCQTYVAVDRNKGIKAKPDSVSIFLKIWRMRILNNNWVDQKAITIYFNFTLSLRASISQNILSTKMDFERRYAYKMLILPSQTFLQNENLHYLHSTSGPLFWTLDFKIDNKI